MYAYRNEMQVRRGAPASSGPRMDLTVTRDMTMGLVSLNPAILKRQIGPLTGHAYGKVAGRRRVATLLRGFRQPGLDCEEQGGPDEGNVSRDETGKEMLS